MRLQSPNAMASMAPSMRRKGSTASLVVAGLRPSTVLACSGICAEMARTRGRAALPVLHTQIWRRAATLREELEHVADLSELWTL